MDTNILSAGAPGRAAKPENVVAWLDEQSDKLFLSAMTIAEIQSGIAKLEREKARRKAGLLADWLDAVLHFYGERILAFDVEVARIAGAMADHALALGRHPGLADIIIAATARRHRLTILTRNRRHFDPLGVRTADPFVSLPDET